MQGRRGQRNYAGIHFGLIETGDAGLPLSSRRAEVPGVVVDLHKWRLVADAARPDLDVLMLRRVR